MKFLLQIKLFYLTQFRNNYHEIIFHLLLTHLSILLSNNCSENRTNDPTQSFENDFYCSS